jgi:hypothetical protein
MTNYSTRPPERRSTTSTDDDLRMAKGILLGLPIGLAMWGLLILLLAWAW